MIGGYQLQTQIAMKTYVQWNDQSDEELDDPLFPLLPDPDPLLPDLPEPDPLPQPSSLELEDPQPKRRVSSVRRRPDLPLLPEEELEHGLPMKIEQMIYE